MNKREILKFHIDKKVIGRLSWEDGVIIFEGNAAKSAKIFFEHLKGHIGRYITEQTKRGSKQ